MACVLSWHMTGGTEETMTDVRESVRVDSLLAEIQSVHLLYTSLAVVPLYEPIQSPYRISVLDFTTLWFPHILLENDGVRNVRTCSASYMCLVLCVIP
jgi:hypothetical protein